MAFVAGGSAVAGRQRVAAPPSDAAADGSCSRSPFEGLRLLRNPFVGLGLAAIPAIAFGASPGTTRMALSGGSPLAIVSFLAILGAASRDRSPGIDELLGPAPAGRRARTARLLPSGAFVVVPATAIPTVCVAGRLGTDGAVTVGSGFHEVLWEPAAAELLQGPLALAGLAMLAVAIGRWARHPPCAPSSLNEGRGDHPGDTHGSSSTAARSSSAQRRPRRSPRRHSRA